MDKVIKEVLDITSPDMMEVFGNMKLGDRNKNDTNEGKLLVYIMKRLINQPRLKIMI